MKKTLGIYIHIPFCVKKCNYCDFCSFTDKSGSFMAEYADELCRRIEEYRDRAKGYTVDTVYFGGGTPSLLPTAQTYKILNKISETFCVSDGAEITLECNPATADAEKLSELRCMGVNRLSIGLQSAHDGELLALGRIHGRDDFLACYSDARRAGFDNISADLMYGIPLQSMESFAESIDFLTALAPEHISSYGLTVEEGTDFYRRRDEICVADGDGQADMYALLGEKLDDAGYVKYEISNFSRAGYESRHNLRYWHCLEYLGFGVAAHSYFEGVRFGNSRDIGAFLSGEDIVCESSVISEGERAAEYVMLRLRLTKGISVSEYRERFGRDLFEAHDVEKYIKAGLMRLCDGRLSFTESGFFVSNAVLADILP